MPQSWSLYLLVYKGNLKVKTFVCKYLTKLNSFCCFILHLAPCTTYSYILYTYLYCYHGKQECYWLYLPLSLSFSFPFCDIDGGKR